MRAEEDEIDTLEPMKRGISHRGRQLTVIGTLLVALFYVGNDEAAPGGSASALSPWASLLAQGMGRVDRYYTGTHHSPVQEVAESAETGPATVVLAGTASGLESSVYAVLAIAIAIGTASPSVTATSSSRSTSSPSAVWECSPRPG